MIQIITTLDITVIIKDFISKFTAFTEEDSTHRCRKFRYNIWFYLKNTSIYI